jgi:hypothetical protein
MEKETLILECNCIKGNSWSYFQSYLYGKGKRIHIVCGDTAKCSVCGKVKQLQQEQVNQNENTRN